MNGLDFILATQPRSGSHMLAFALDSHPDINMSGELYTSRYEFSGEGTVCGAIVHAFILDEVLPVKKIICLTRSPGTRAVSSAHKCDGELHYFKPSTEHRNKSFDLKDRIETLQSHTNDLKMAVKGFDVLHLDYDEITGGKHIDTIPGSKEICQFLGVSDRELKTKTYKPSTSYVN